jgi:ABC-2 type transport system ATP-binding protein
MHAIEAHGLVKIYPAPGKNPRIRALDGLDLIVEPGTIFALVGPNGAGKTKPTGSPTASRSSTAAASWLRASRTSSSETWRSRRSTRCTCATRAVGTAMRSE